MPPPGPCHGKSAGTPCGPSRCDGRDRIDLRCNANRECQPVATRCALACLLNRCTVGEEGEGEGEGNGNGNGKGNGNGNGGDGDDDDDDDDDD